MNGIKTFLAVVVLFLFSLFQSCSELRLSLSGVHEQAKIESVTMEVDKRTGVETGRYKVNYHFRADDGGTMRDIRSDVAVGRSEAELRSTQETVDVIYLPSNPYTNRVVGHRQWLWVALFLVFLAMALGYGLYLWRQAQADLRRARR